MLIKYCKCGHSYKTHKTKLFIYSGEDCKVCQDCKFFARREMTPKQVLRDIMMITGVMYGIVGMLLAVGIDQKSPIEIIISIIIGSILYLPLSDIIKSKLRYFTENKPIVEDSLT